MLSHQRKSADSRRMTLHPSIIAYFCKKVKSLCLILAALLVIASPTISVSAAEAGASSMNANDFVFSDFSADYYLSKAEDGTSRLKVVESLTAQFPEYDQNHGIERFIPYTNQNGKNLTMQSASRLDVKVQRNGVDEPYTYDSEDGYFKLRIGNADRYVYGKQVYTLEYEFVNVITNQTNENSDPTSWQELYWDTNGNDWTQPFGSVTARLHVDESLKSHLNRDLRACYTGAYGATERTCIILPTDDGYTFTASSINPRENLTFIAGFDTDTFVVPEPPVSYLGFIIAGIITLSAIFVLVYAMKVWAGCKEKREHYKLQFVKPEYAPDPKYTLAELAMNYMGPGGTGNVQVATLMELAVNGKIEIIRAEVDGVLSKKKKTWQVRVLSLDMTEEQSIVLKILNGKNEALTVGQLITVKNHTATRALERLAHDFRRTTIKKLDKLALSETADLDQSSSANGRPMSKQAAKLLVVSLIWTFAAIVVGAISMTATSSYKVYPYIEILIVFCIILVTVTASVSIVITIKSDSFYTRTEKGLDLSRFTEGLRLYISMAESERIKFLQSVSGADTTANGIVKLYEKLLPYAIFFGMEKSWFNELGRYYAMSGVEDPTWYSGVGVFSAHAFVHDLSSISSTAGAAIMHSSAYTSSSGGSGFSGGGFSGGGGGGGGGGGW